MNKHRINKWIILAVVALLAIQFIPIDRTNPSVVFEPEWDSPKRKNTSVVHALIAIAMKQFGPGTHTSLQLNS